MKNYSNMLKNSMVSLSRGKFSLTKSDHNEEMVEKTIPFFLPFDGFSDDHTIFRIGETANKIVEWNTNFQTMMLLAGSENSGKTNMQRNVISHCLYYHKNWDIYFISLKSSKFDAYEKLKNVKSIARTIEEATIVVSTVRDKMLSRYKKMEKQRVNNFNEMPENPKKIILIIDDADTIISTNKMMSTEMVHQILEIQGKINQIGRLARAAGVSVLLSTTRPDLIVPGELRANIALKISLKTIHPIGSYFLFDNDEASKIDSSIINRGYYKIYGEGGEFQSYSSPESWISEKLAKNKDR